MLTLKIVFEFPIVPFYLSRLIDWFIVVEHRVCQASSLFTSTNKLQEIYHSG